MMRVCQIVPDERDVRDIDADAPFFGSAPTALLEGFALFSNEIEIHVVSCARKGRSAPKQLTDNVFYHQVSVSGGYRRTLFFEAIQTVRQKIETINPDVVHGQGTEDYPGICAAFSGYPNCITIHGNMRRVARRLKYRPFPAMAITAVAELVALRKTDAVICLSSYTMRNVKKLARRTITIPNAVDSRFFDIRRRLVNPASPGLSRTGDSCSVGGEDLGAEVVVNGNLSTDQHSNSSTAPAAPVLLCIGTVVGYKNQLALIRALEPLAGQHTFQLRFVGSGGVNDPYVKQVQVACRKHDWCEWVGQVSRQGIMEELLQASLLVHPSLEDNCPMVLLEAMAAGVPVAASAIGGIPDLVDDGRTGFLFDPANPASITSAVEKFLKNQDELARLGHTARQHALSTFSPRAIAERHIEFYRQLLS